VLPGRWSPAVDHGGAHPEPVAAAVLDVRRPADPPPAVVFFGSASGSTVVVGGERLAFTALGMVIALLVGLVTNLIVRATEPRLSDRKTNEAETVADTARSLPTQRFAYCPDVAYRLCQRCPESD